MAISRPINLVALRSGSTLVCKDTYGLPTAVACIFIRIYSASEMKVGHHITSEKGQASELRSAPKLFFHISVHFTGLHQVYFEIFFFNWEVVMVSVIHRNVFAKGQTPV